MIIRRSILTVIVIAILTACQVGQTPTPAIELTRTAIAVARESWTDVPVVSAQPTNTKTSTPTLTPTSTATATFTATNTPTDSPTATPRIVVITNTPDLSGLPPTDPPPPTDGPTPTSPPYKQNFALQRPFTPDLITYWARNYSYGSTEGGIRKPHHGIDIANPSGTPVLAAADGVVYFSGQDIQTIFASQPDFYGNVVVIKHNFTDSAGEDVYTLYGHLFQATVQQGREVKAGDQIGVVGATGIAIGPHLHLEVRVRNPLSYDSTRNPELWMIPYPNHGVLAGRVTSKTDGRLLEEVMVEVRSLSTGAYYAGYTYSGDSVKGDAALKENFAIGDLPAGDYNVFVNLPDYGLVFRRTMYIDANKTNWVDITIQK